MIDKQMNRVQYKCKERKEVRIMSEDKKQKNEETGEETVKRQFDEALEQGTSDDDKKRKQEKNDK